MVKKIIMDGVTYYLVPVPQKVDTVTPWSACDLKSSTIKALVNDGVTHLEKVFECSAFVLLHIPGVGRRTFQKIRDCVQERYPGRHIGDLVETDNIS